MLLERQGQQAKGMVTAAHGMPDAHVRRTALSDQGDPSKCTVHCTVLTP